MSDEDAPAERDRERTVTARRARELENRQAQAANRRDDHGVPPDSEDAGGC
jgi:hypothetical protein